jgi:quercetin dioxygenase-like cupin family protein
VSTVEALSLSTLGDEQVAAATAATAGRSAKSIYGGSGRVLRQTVLALASGHGLDDHESPGEATLLVLRGRIRLGSTTQAIEAAAGDYLVIPEERHNVAALEDSVLLLTVVPRS